MTYIQPDKPQDICFLQWRTAKEKDSYDSDIVDEDVSDADSQKGVNKHDLVDQIFPPREWVVDTGELGEQIWTQSISKDLPSRAGIKDTSTMLKVYEEFFGVRKTGICELRSALYVSYFDEALRQIAVINETLGRLLFRVREDLRNTAFVYKMLHERSLTYSGMYSDRSTYEEEMEQEVEYLIKINEAHETKIETLNTWLDKFRENVANRSAQSREMHEISVKSLKRSINQLSEQLNTLAPLMRSGDQAVAGKQQEEEAVVATT
ncbi:33 kDa inner dynein arm light chain, axonemal-like [Adelges cooleyi]|uniref:33 kDa inner dynein arm light chain, axonemal-like n=1 Tax=Adelges cooleyi TaxID=133065 RepID=UPI00217FAB4B|nr:33 kDa inner dynein arm light chain, axonemal-like [Adelges cooleyi]